jgi:hypothetical protein
MTGPATERAWQVRGQQPGHKLVLLALARMTDEGRGLTIGQLAAECGMETMDLCGVLDSLQRTAALRTVLGGFDWRAGA